MNALPPPGPNGEANAGAQQGPPEDRFAYRIAVGAVGVALVAFLIGAAVIAAGGKPVPTQYWASGSAISGALLGILAPSPKRIPLAKQANVRKTVGSGILGIVEELWKNRAILILMAVFVVSVIYAITRNSAPLETVAAAAGGALVGMLAPPPGKPGE
jgi:Na+/melibiose symporter-like transporter